MKGSYSREGYGARIILVSHSNGVTSLLFKFEFETTSWSMFSSWQWIDLEIFGEGDSFLYGG